MAVRPTFMGFETATRGLMVNQKSLDIVGNNLGNIGVTGYTRQRADLVSLNVNTQYTRYSQNNIPFAGQGAGVYGISQIRNTFLDRRFREEYSDVGYYSVTSNALEDLASALDEIAPSNMTVAMTNFYNAWDDILQKGDEATGAANLLANATQIVQVFRQMSAKLDNVWNQQEYNLKLEVENVNKILENIALLNEQISKQQYNAMEVDNKLYQPLELMDQRNVLLDQLSEYSNISYETKEDGTVTVWMGVKSDDNPPAVEGKNYQQMHVRVDETDPDFKTVSLYWNESGKELVPDTGSLRGMYDMLNGRGLAMNQNGRTGETYTQGILYYKDKVDQFAKTFVDAFNHVIEEIVPDGADPLFKALFAFENDSYETAASIKVSDDWVNNHEYLITNLKDKLDGESDNTYAAKAKNLFETALDFGEFKGTINDYISFYTVTKLGNDKNYADTRLTATTEIADTILNQIQEVSGVSMDEEGVDMMMYQKAYDAVSRVFTTLDEMLDKLINGTGIVGR